MASGDGKHDSNNTVSLADEAGVKDILESTVLGLWELVNNLTRLRPSNRERYRVTIFGSARAEEGTFVYDETRRMARAFAEIDCDILTGGGPGLMRAANQGATDAAATGDRSVGIRIALPFEQETSAFVTRMHSHRTFFTRLHHFVLASDAFVVTPGGIGTVLEAMMVWQLLQVGHVTDAPLVFVGKMWSGLVEWARESMLDPRLAMASREDLAIPRCVATGDEAVALVRADHQQWLARRKER